MRSCLAAASSPGGHGRGNTGKWACTKAALQLTLRYRSLRILTAADGEAAAPIPAQTAATGMMGDASGSPTLRSKSLLGCAKGIMSNNTCGKVRLQVR